MSYDDWKASEPDDGSCPYCGRLGCPGRDGCELEDPPREKETDHG